MNNEVTDDITEIVNHQPTKDNKKRDKHRLCCPKLLNHGINTKYVIRTEHPEVTDINTTISLEYGFNYELIEINLENPILPSV